jgi:heat shock protein HslJ
MRKFRYLIIGLTVLMAVILPACSTAGGLDATSWKLESYADTAGDMMDVLPESAITLNFQADQVSGIASCNNYSGPYQTTGSKIEFGPLATTRKMCAQPLGIMEQEATYLAALETAAEYDLQGNMLEIKDNQGDVSLVFSRAAGD